MEAAESMEKKQKKGEVVFPKIPKDYKPSAKVMAMTLGKLPEGVDLEKELESCSSSYVRLLQRSWSNATEAL